MNYDLNYPVVLIVTVLVAVICYIFLYFYWSMRYRYFKNKYERTAADYYDVKKKNSSLYSAHHKLEERLTEVEEELRTSNTEVGLLSHLLSFVSLTSQFKIVAYIGNQHYINFSYSNKDGVTVRVREGVSKKYVVKKAELAYLIDDKFILPLASYGSQIDDLRNKILIEEDVNTTNLVFDILTKNGEETIFIDTTLQ